MTASAGDDQRDRHHRVHRAVRGDLVDHPAGQHRGGHPDQRVERRPRPGTAAGRTGTARRSQHPPAGAGAQRPLGQRRIPPHRAHDGPVAAGMAHDGIIDCRRRLSAVRRATAGGRQSSASSPASSRSCRYCASRSARSCSAWLRSAAASSSALISVTAARGSARIRSTNCSPGAGQLIRRARPRSTRPDPQRLRGRHRRPGQADRGRPGVADQLDQPLGTAEVGHQAQADLGHGELRVLGRDPEVAGQRELEAGADRVALHQRDADQARTGEDAERLLVAGDLGGGLAPADIAASSARFWSRPCDAVRGEHPAIQAGREGRPLAAQRPAPGRCPAAR